MKAKTVYALIEVNETFGNVVQCEELLMPAVYVIHREVGPLQLIIEGLPQTRADVQQGQEPRRIKPAAVAKSSANQVVIVGRDGLEDTEQSDGIIDLHVRAANEAGGIKQVGFTDMCQGALQLEGSSFQQQFRALMDYLESEFVRVQELGNVLLQCQQLVCAEIALVIGGSGSGQYRFAQIVSGAPPGAGYFFFGDEQGGVLYAPDEGRLKPGDVVTCAVPHCDPTVNLYDCYHLIRGDRLEAIWPIEASGRSA